MRCCIVGVGRQRKRVRKKGNGERETGRQIDGEVAEAQNVNL